MGDNSGKTRASYYENVTKDADKAGPKKGLNTEVNPLLFSSNLNLVKKQHKLENPYLDHSDSRGKANYRKINDRFNRGLVFHAKGEISEAYEQEREILRKKLEQQEEERLLQKKQLAEHSEKVKLGLLPDTRIAEDKYFIEINDIPDIEWWDVPFLDKNNQILKKYGKILADDEDSESDNEEEDDQDEGKINLVDHPSLRYIQHPSYSKESNKKLFVNKIYLTKDERKKFRRNRKKIEREEKETKIRLGVIPKPEPKVKLSNLMNVYENNQNITDPTQWENTVKNQVQERKRIHEETNQLRHEEAIKRRQLNDRISKPIDPAQELICKVFRFKSLVNPSIRFKLKANSKQLKLRGACMRVRDDGPGVIIISGNEKSCRFYEKLVMSRIKWNESFIEKDTKTEIDLNDNTIEKVWEGYLRDSKFPNWFMRSYENEEEIKFALERFNAAQLYQFIFRNVN